MILKVIAGILVSYLVGSIPTAYIFGKLYRGIDIRHHGSGNIGATNVFRVLGKGPGIIVLIIDIVKGILPVVIISSVFGLTENWQKILIALAAVCGHNWTIFLQFKGGKGIATSLGVLIGLMITISGLSGVVLLTLLVWIVVFLTTAIVSISSIIAGIALPIFMVVTDQPFEIILLGAVFCVFVVVRHKPNIHRLIAGQENKVPLPFHKKNL